MSKLIILSGSMGIGGATVSLSLLLKGFQQCGASERVSVLVHSGSTVEQYLRQNGQFSCLQPIEAENQNQFFRRAFQWIGQQPKNWPLLLENGTARCVLKTMLLYAPILRLSGRSIYHSFHDTAYSKSWQSNLVRKVIFACLNPVGICNSQFTANQVCPRLLSQVKAIVYPSVDTEKFKPSLSSSPPILLQPILQSGARIMLTPSRISQPGQMNDKNLRTLIYVLAELKAWGHHYHGVVIGQDTSAEKIWTRQLLQQAKQLNVEDRFTILPATFAIKDYYNYADVVVTLAPREPFGLTVVEAIACGVPVVGSRTGGIAEILHHFAPQWTVDPFDPELVAETIIHIANDPNTPNLLNLGRQWIKEQCNPKNYAKQILEITRLNSLNYLDNKHPSQSLTQA